MPNQSYVNSAALITTFCTGVGKTALIKAIVQTSDAIVHVDPIPSPSSSPARRSSSRTRAKLSSSGNGNGTSQIREIFASTKPLPEWWSDLDGSQVLKLRRSVGGDTILDRNICFIDTPGHSGGPSVGFGPPEQGICRCAYPVAEYGDHCSHCSLR